MSKLYCVECSFDVVARIRSACSTLLLSPNRASRSHAPHSGDPRSQDAANPILPWPSQPSGGRKV